MPNRATLGSAIIRWKSAASRSSIGVSRTTPSPSSPPSKNGR